MFDVSDIWADTGWQDGDLSGSMAHAKKSMTIAGRQWGVPYTYYQWGVYYRKDIFEQMGIAVPANWADFIGGLCKIEGWRNTNYHWLEVSVDHGRRFRLSEFAHKWL